MSLSLSDFLPNDQLPTRQEIETICLSAGLDGRGIALRKSPGGSIVAWAKYGVNVTTAEAFTQEWVARGLAADPTTFVHVPRVFDTWILPKPYFNVGFIVMEYVDLPDCNRGDSKLVADAVLRLHGVEAPGPAPGPIGGGPPVHHFFVDWDSRITYATIRELQEHINNVLRAGGHKNRVSLGDRLLLCPSDINPGNFKKGQNGEVFALDFRASCFMPMAFFSYVLRMPVNAFASLVVRHIKYQRSTDVAAMVSASSRFVLHGKNDIALPISIFQRMSR